MTCKNTMQWFVNVFMSRYPRTARLLLLARSTTLARAHYAMGLLGATLMLATSESRVIVSWVLTTLVVGVCLD
jgi:hypothetical protein